MLIDVIGNVLLKELEDINNSYQIDMEALETIFNFSRQYFSIDSQYIRENNDMIDCAYNRVQKSEELLKTATCIMSMEKYDVSRIGEPKHELLDDLIALSTYRIIRKSIDEYIKEGGHFRRGTFVKLMNSIRHMTYDISNSCLREIIYLECIEFCANKLKEFGITNNTDLKYLAKEWKNSTSNLYPERPIEEEYLTMHPYLRDSKHFKKEWLSK